MQIMIAGTFIKPPQKADILAQLQKDIFCLQGFKPTPNSIAIDAGLGPIRYAFPNNSFPLGAVHEFICEGPEDSSATSGFISGILSTLMRLGGVSLWIGSARTIFPPGLKNFGLNPDKIIFIDLQKEKDVLWAMEEALKSNRLAAVVGEMQELSFTISRRLQLAVEQSRITGFILRRNPYNLNTTACVTRWKITALPSVLEEKMPGVGFPRWNIELLKVRNGKPGTWQLEWAVGRFRHMSKITTMSPMQKKKTG